MGAVGKKMGRKAASFAKVAMKASTAPGPSKPPLGSKAALAQLCAKNPPPPPRPSLVLSLTHHMLALTLRTTAALAPLVLVNVCNAALSANPIHANVQDSTAKWSPRGILVIFAGPDITCDALFATSSLLTSAISWALPDDLQISSHFNVKWGKVIINSVPTSITRDYPTIHSLATCWQLLIDNNPSLHHLKVCQPSLFLLGSQSSLQTGPWLPPSSVHIMCTPLGHNAMLCSGTTPPPPPLPNVPQESLQRRPRTPGLAPNWLLDWVTCQPLFLSLSCSLLHCKSMPSLRATHQ